MSTNDITGARLISRANNKDYDEGYDRIFSKKPCCLDAAYERKAMKEGMNSSPVFEENKQDTKRNCCLDMPEPRGRCVMHDNEKVEND